MTRDVKPLGSNLLLAVTGSLFAASVPQIVLTLRFLGVFEDIRVITTWSATKFVAVEALRKVTGHEVLVSLDDDSREFVVPHVELARWADVMLVMPATANALASLAHGAADNIVTTTALGVSCPLVVVPGMDSPMWHHRLVQRNVATLREIGYVVVDSEPGLDVRTLQLKEGGFASLESVVDATAKAIDADVRFADYLSGAS